MTIDRNQGNFDTEEPAPTIKEVEQAIKKLKNNKAPGMDLIMEELVKFAGPEYAKHLHQLIVKIWITEIIPEEWNLSTVCPIHKKGDVMKQASNIVKIFKVAEIVEGQSMMLLVDCLGAYFSPYIFVEINLYLVGWEQKGRKRSKRVKQLMNGSPAVTLSEKQGRCLETVQSMVNFMCDPTGDIPWEEDSSAIDVVHISDTLESLYCRTFLTD
ncbi:hypothetical protein B7P43_G11860 [Cryptotermes secundus]|uniref:Uncharacterized protein n=1 Tax=Cryptotermes secundus TaxID=105785 RepID=A0A2J7QKQ5_9NEOP|nr:hypothetical protein B7P43_G11860 [Cryptotermes secundus]